MRGVSLFFSLSTAKRAGGGGGQLSKGLEMTARRQGLLKGSREPEERRYRDREARERDGRVSSRNLRGAGAPRANRSPRERSRSTQGAKTDKHDDQGRDLSEQIDWVGWMVD